MEKTVKAKGMVKRIAEGKALVCKTAATRYAGL